VSTAPGLAPSPLDLDRFMAEEYPGVVAAVRLIAGDTSDAEDAVQDALVRLLSRPPAAPLRSVAAWVTVVASNEARMRHRRAGAERRALDRLDVPTVHEPDDVAQRRTVLDALHALPVGQRQVAVLHYLLDASVADVAAALGVTEGTVKTQLHRARAALAAALGDAAGGAPDQEVTRDA